ncbi:MAG TPA: hypothetical protein VLD57_06320 [Blastocatellia bacterium]|nr:hypothetical protein [Blastocatellia bacterium]
MKLLSLQEAESSSDFDIKMLAVRASRYRVFGSTERIPHTEMAVFDLRDGGEPADFADRYQVLDRHPVSAIYLVRKIGE